MKRRMILASASPRRIELMKLVIPEYDVITADTDETVLPGESPEQLVYRLAFRKAEEVFRKTEGPRVVIGADTVVALGQRILGKPADQEDAREMLSSLSGRRHSVFTGVAVLWEEAGELRSARFVDEAQVEFYPLSPQEIEGYIASGEPFGKAGGYAIQLQGGVFVRAVQGDYHCIVGLPVSRLYHVMLEQGLISGFPGEFSQEREV